MSGNNAVRGQVDETTSVYARIPGGSELIAWFGYVPDFHDAEIVELSLRRRAPSVFRVHTWITRDEIDKDGYFVKDRHVVVSFMLEGIVDLQLESFNHKNVISGLILRHAPDDPERRPYYSLSPSLEDLAIELEPCFGLEGRIRCRKVRIDLTPGKPNEAGG